MNRIFTLLLTFLFLSVFSGYTQTLDWGINIGGHVDEYPIDIHKVPGGIVMSSTYDGLRKYDTEGNQKWSFDFFKNVHDDFDIMSSDVDDKGNIYVALSVPGDWGKTKLINDFEFFVGLNLVKIDPQGEIVWVRHIGGTSGIVKYKNRSVYIVGRFLESISINNEVDFISKKYYDCFSWIERYGMDIFLAKFSDIGVLEEAVQYGNDFHDYASSMQVDDEGNVFLAAMHEEYSCVTSFSNILRFDKNLNLEWDKKITTEERDDYLFSPENLFLSENGNLYLITKGYYGTSNDEFEIPDSQTWTFNIMEYDSASGDFLRINSYAKGTWTSRFVPPSPFLNNMYLQDYKDNLIVFTSANRKLTFDNKEFVPQSQQENLLLFKVNKKNFTSEYITHFEAEIHDTPDYVAIDNPGRIFIDEDKLYLSAAFESTPLHMFGEEISNNSGNNDRDILLAKIDISSLSDPEDDQDDDNDGVVNYKDYCPDTPEGVRVDARGCSSIQNDLDGDGVINRKDDCPETREGARVDENGCEILNLPTDNFRISTTSESCNSANDGNIQIEVEDNSYQYDLWINGEEEVIAFTDWAEVNGLSDGSYNLCIRVDGFSDYEKCFTLEIESPEPLEVYSMVNNDKTEVQLQLSGGENYTIHHNERTIETKENDLNLKLEKGKNSISVNTDKSCQGVHQEIIYAGEEMLLYPNPVSEHFILDGESDSNIPITVKVYSLSGQMVLAQDFLSKELMRIDASGLASGTYLVKVNSEEGTESFKIFKK